MPYGGEKKAKPCYTSFALSDLVVSGGCPSFKAIQPGTDFPKPLQRDHLGLEQFFSRFWVGAGRQ